MYLYLFVIKYVLICNVERRQIKLIHFYNHNEKF